jgi:beta-glucosidase/6-phospho-beta-glucosidase/beta-galactosidase
LLHHVRKTWTDPTLTCDGRDLAILVTENGYAEQDEAELPMESIINDTHRQEYFDSYICELVSARNAGVPIDGYFGWSLLE